MTENFGRPAATMPSLPQISLRNREDFLTPRYSARPFFAVQTFHLVPRRRKIQLLTSSRADVRLLRLYSV